MRIIDLALAGALALPPNAGDWEQAGRPLPKAEVGAVRIDPQLAPYAACRPTLAGAASGSVTTILPDLFARWRRGFAERQPQASISSPPPYGPPQGKLSENLRAFLEGESQFALVSRALTAEDRATYRKAHGAEPIVIPVAAGSWRHFGFADTVVVIVNRANPLRQLSYAQIDALFSAQPLRGEPSVRDWGQLGVLKWRGRAVHVVGAAGWLREDSARSAVVRQRVLLGGEWRADFAESGEEATGPESVARDPLAIAITGLGHLPAGTRALAISEGPSGPWMAPSHRAVAADRYPLSRTIDMLAPRQADGAIDSVVAEFLRYVLSREGQAAIADQGVFLPLTADQARRSLAMLGDCPV